MLRVAIRSMLMAIPVLLGVSALVFLLIDITPGDAARVLAGDSPTPERIAEIRRTLGLDRPLVVRYGEWLGDAVTGDLGTSTVTRERVSEVIMRRVPVTASLVGFSVVVVIVGGLGLGVLAAMHEGKWIDRTVLTFSSLLLAAPQFWIGLLLILSLAVNLGWFPALGYSSLRDGVWDWAHHLILPAITLATVAMGEVVIQLRAALIGVLRRDYVTTAEAKGLTRYAVVTKHALKNASVPVITVLGYRLAQMVGGSVIIEQVFNLRGLGNLASNSVLDRDVSMLLGLVMLTTMFVLFVNVLVDISYGYFNPKVR